MFGEGVGEGGPYTVVRGLGRDVSGLAYYNHNVPWEAMVENVWGGESVKVLDRQGETAGYALFARGYRAGEQTSVVLSQCEAAPGRSDEEAVVRAALSAVFAPTERELKRVAPDFVSSSGIAEGLLAEAGFTVEAERHKMIWRRATP